MPTPSPPTTSSSLQKSFPSIPIAFLLQRADLLPIRDLPAQRPLVWTQPDRCHNLFFAKDLDRVLTSAVVQVAGVKADRACRRCREGKGEWTECVIPPVHHALKTWWACSNCHKDNQTGCCELYMDTEQLNRLKKGAFTANSSHHHLRHTNATTMDPARYPNRAIMPGPPPPPQGAPPASMPGLLPPLPISRPGTSVPMSLPPPMPTFPPPVPRPISMPALPAAPLTAAPIPALPPNAVTPGPKALQVSPEQLPLLYQPVDPKMFFKNQPPGTLKRKRAESAVIEPEVKNVVDRMFEDTPTKVQGVVGHTPPVQYPATRYPQTQYPPAQYPPAQYSSAQLAPNSSAQVIPNSSAQVVPTMPLPPAPGNSIDTRNIEPLQNQPRTPTHMDNPRPPVLLNQPRTPFDGPHQPLRTVYASRRCCPNSCPCRDTPSSYNSPCSPASTSSTDSPLPEGTVNDFSKGLPAHVDPTDEELLQFTDPRPRVPTPEPVPEPPPVDKFGIPRIDIRVRPCEYRTDPDPSKVMKTSNDPTLLPWPVIDPEDLAVSKHVAELMDQPLMTIEELERELDGWYE